MLVIIHTMWKSEIVHFCFGRVESCLLLYKWDQIRKGSFLWIAKPIRLRAKLAICPQFAILATGLIKSLVALNLQPSCPMSRMRIVSYRRLLYSDHFVICLSFISYMTLETRLTMLSYVRYAVTTWGKLYPLSQVYNPSKQNQFWCFILSQLYNPLKQNQFWFLTNRIKTQGFVVVVWVKRMRRWTTTFDFSILEDQPPPKSRAVSIYRKERFYSRWVTKWCPRVVHGSHNCPSEPLVKRKSWEVQSFVWVEARNYIMMAFVQFCTWSSLSKNHPWLFFPSRYMNLGRPLKFLLCWSSIFICI